MAQLTFVKMHDDGASLLLRAHDGAEFHLPVCDNLRAAIGDIADPVTAELAEIAADCANSGRVRQSNPTKSSGEQLTLDKQMSIDKSSAKSANSAARTDKAIRESGAHLAESSILRPAEIQTLLRAGASVAELAESTGADPERIRRFEHAIVSERQYVISSVRDLRVAGFDGTATVAELADARLQARGVDLADVVWSALRHPGTPWRVEVRFPAGEVDRCARWNFDLRSRHLTPLDDEARWLSQPDDPITAEVVPVSLARRAEATLDGTEAILKDLDSRRGRRTGEAAGSRDRKTAAAKSRAKAPAAELPVKPTSSVITAEIDVAEAAEPQPVTSRAPIVELNPGARAASGNRSARKRPKPTRAAMPSWDEIMLGPKRED